MTPDPNVLQRTEPCARCGDMMLWTQNAWAHGNNRAAAYQCPNGHVIDPAETRRIIAETLIAATAHAAPAAPRRFVDTW